MNQNNIELMTVLFSVGYVLLFVVIGILFTLLIIGGAICAFFQLTHIISCVEFKKNNVSIALISAALILGLALIMKDHIAGICEALIPYPEVVGIW